MKNLSLHPDSQKVNLEALFNLSYGMYILSSRKEDKINGCIVNTGFQVIPEPPMVAVSICKKNLTHEYITSSKLFVISILAEEAPMDFIGTFGFKSGRDIDKFENANYKLGGTDIPVLIDNTVGFLEAQVTDHVDLDTHTLFIAKILSCQEFANGKMPMTYNYYRDIKHGKTPRAAATFSNLKPVVKHKERTPTMNKYRCTLCSYVYDPEIGDPDNGIEPGTAFANIPDDWVCPECGADKDEFEVE